jgi:hypothetical protein
VGIARASWATRWRLLAPCLVLAAAVTASAASAGGSAASTPRQLVVYSYVTQEEFNNHSDDRTRGAANNPFGNFKQSTSVTREPGVGPFAGDRANFFFKLYSDSALKKPIGSATLACQYGFSKRAICQAVYLVKGGTLIGIGGLDFNSRAFALAVTGGTGKSLDASGDVQATQVASRTNRLAFAFA